MTDTTTAAMPRQSLGVIGLLAESIGLIFRHFFNYLLALMIPAGLFVGLMAATFGAVGNAISALNTPAAVDAGVFGVIVGVAVAGMVLFAVVYALIVAVTVKIKRGERVAIIASMPRAMGAVLRLSLVGLCFIPIYVLLIATVAGVGSVAGNAAGAIAVLAAVVFGLWVSARLGLILPTVVAERIGISALGRSWHLTGGYVWPIIGGYLLLSFLSIATQVILSLLLSIPLIFVGDAQSLGVFSIAGWLLSVIPSLILTLLPLVFLTLVYLRLREIKEGTGAEDIARIFE
ncbi:MAG: hypothetical protein AAGE76_07115 [Pseudomonadota bacterium]